MTKNYSNPQDLLNKRILIEMGYAVIDVVVNKVSPEGTFIYVTSAKDCGPKSGIWIRTPDMNDVEILGDI